MLNIEELDHEFITEGSPDAEGERFVGMAQQNLNEKEIQRMLELIPAVKEYQLYMIKAETGEFPEGAEEFIASEGQGMAVEQGSDVEVPQEDQSEVEAPPRLVEEEMVENQVEMAENVPRMMSAGGEVNISDILEGDKPDWLIRALDPSTKMTKNNESIRSYTGSMDGRQILVPSIRMVDGELVRYKPEEAFRIAREKQDYLVIPAKSDEEAEAYSKALSNEISRRRQQSGMALGGTPPVIEQQQPAAPAPVGDSEEPSGIIAEPRADNSGVADDISKTVDEGDFIINKAAVEEAGVADVVKMIEDAEEKKQELSAKGVIESGNAMDKPQSNEKVEIRISNGEVRIRKDLVDIIGLDRLTKINNRGLAKTEEKLEEQKVAKQGTPTPERSVGEGALRPEILQGNKGGLIQKKNLQGQMSDLT